MSFKSGILRKTRCQLPDDIVPTLYQVHDRAQFPKLTWLIDSLYDNPQIQPSDADILAKEIEALEWLLITLKLPFPMVALQKLKGFFQAAADKQQVISTFSQ